MSVNRSQRVKNMFAPPKTLDSGTGDQETPTDETIKDNDKKKNTELIDISKNIIKTEDDQKKIDTNTEKFTETTKSKEVISCRTSIEMKNSLEDMAKDFAYLARKKYGIKIKDDTSSIIRAFLLLGMSCFTENIQHQILQEFDAETPLQQEISQKLLSLMKIYNVEIDEIDINILNL